MPKKIQKLVPDTIKLFVNVNWLDKKQAVWNNLSLGRRRRDPGSRLETRRL